jgi:hypothetical protein
VLLVSGLGLDTYAQVKVSLTDQRMSRLNKSPDARSRLARYRKYQKKDELKAMKDRQKFVKDSLRTAPKLPFTVPGCQPPLDSIRAIEARKGQLSKDSIDLLKRQFIRRYCLGNRPDSLDGLGTMQRYGMYGAMKDMYGQSKTGTVPTDSASLAQKLAMEQRLKSLMPQDMQKGLGEPPGGIGNDYKSLSEPSVKSIPLDQFSKNVPGEQMSSATATMSAAKKTHVSMPREGEDVPKRNSLEGQPLKRRIYLGGNITLQSVNPPILDTDIQVGYKFNRDFLMGTGFIIREQFDERPSMLVGDAYGYSVFANHKIPLGLFAYAEIQNMRTQSLFQDNLVQADWQQAYNLGIGKEIPVLPWLNLTTMVLYDFNHKNNGLSARPFSIRIGYRLSELAMR